MKSIEESVIIAMDGSDTELFPFLPYILQDIWEIGSDPEIIIKLINSYFKDDNNLKVLDLGCGKGAVSVKLAQSLGCSCHGIDAIEEFIQYAKQKAFEYEVAHLCRFEVADVRKIVYDLPEYDVIILGAVGPIMGDYFDTFSILNKHLKSDGIIIIDDGYIDNSSDYEHPIAIKYDEMLKQTDAASMRLIDKVAIEDEQMKESNELIYSNLRNRCIELIDKHPERKTVFVNYIAEQENEIQSLENELICSTMVFGRKQ